MAGVIEENGRCEESSAFGKQGFGRDNTSADSEMHFKVTQRMIGLLSSICYFSIFVL